MRPTLRVILLALFATSFSLTAQEDPRSLDPSDVFFQAWLTIRDAEKLEEKGSFNEARLKYQQAAKYYDVVARYHKNWKPHLVQTRVRTTKEAIAGIEAKALQQIAQNKAKTADLIEGGPSSNQDPDPSRGTASGHRQQPTKSTPTSSPQPARPTTPSSQYSEAIVRGQQRQLEQLREANQILKQRLQREKQSTQRNASAEQKRLIAKIADKDREIAHIRDLLAKAPLQADLERLERENRTRKAEIDITALSLKGTMERLSKEQALRKKAEEEAQFAERRAKQIQKTMEEQKQADNRVVRELRNELKSVNQILEKTRVQLGNANQKITRLEQTLAQSQATIEELSQERDALRLERDSLVGILKHNDAAGVRKLITENMRLGKELKDSNARLKYLSKKNNVTQDELLEAKRDLAVAKTRIMHYQKKQTQHGNRILALESQLRDAEAALANAQKQQGNGASQEEIEILKATVKRLIAAQDRRKAADDLLWETYKSSKKIIPGLIEAFDDIRNAKVELTEEEKGLMVKRIPDAEFAVPSRVTPEHARASANAMERDIADHNRLVKRFYLKGHHEAARQILADMDERFPGHFPTLCNRGVLEFKTDHYSEAAEIFSEAITMRESNGYAHYMLGLSRYHAEDYDGARNALEQALTLKPNDPKIHFYLGTLAGVGRRYEQSEQHLKQAIKLDPTMAEAHFNLSYLYLNRQLKNKALKAYRNALDHGATPIPEHEKKLGM